MHKHFTITLSGNLVHKGLKFRAMILADKFGIKGSVAENENQIVIEAEGEEKDLNQFFRSFSIYGEKDKTGNSIRKTESRTLSCFEEFIIK